jgi:hypothetical protein
MLASQSLLAHSKDASATWFFTICIVDGALRPFERKATNFVDDIYILKDAMATYPLMAQALATLGLRINTTKTRIISSTQRTLAQLPSPMKQQHTIAKVAGAYVIVDRSMTSDKLTMGLLPALDDYTRKLDRISKLQCSLQYKLALLKHLQWYLLYLVTGSTLEIARLLSCAADERNYTTFAALTGLGAYNTLHVRYFQTWEDGGLNVVPLSLCCKHLQHRHYCTLRRFFHSFGLKHSLPTD